MLYRAWNICSSYDLFTKEASKLKDMFYQNGYHTSFFIDIYNQFLASKYSPKRQKTEMDIKMLLKIPYFGKPSIIFKNKIKELVKRHFDTDIVCVYQSFKVSNYFSLKCQSPAYLDSNVVYKYTCLRDDGLFYIGKTKRHLGIRVAEHLAVRNRTGLTEITKHIQDCADCLDGVQDGRVGLDHFQILSRCRSNYETEIQEAFLIRKQQPKINKQMFNSGASYFVKVFV
jgi:hypothetical protein